MLVTTRWYMDGRWLMVMGWLWDEDQNHLKTMPFWSWSSEQIWGETWIWSLGWSRPAAASSPWCHLVPKRFRTPCRTRAVCKEKPFVIVRPFFRPLKKDGIFLNCRKGWNQGRLIWFFLGINMKNNSLLLGAFKHEFYFPFHMGCHPSRRSPSFFKMVKKHQQAVIIINHIITIYSPYIHHIITIYFPHISHRFTIDLPYIM